LLHVLIILIFVDDYKEENEKMRPKGERLVLSYSLRQTAHRYGKRTAIIFQGQRITYAEMRSRRNKVANALLNHGLKQGDRVNYLLPNCPEVFDVMFGVVGAGLVTVPLNTRFVGVELDYVINDCGSKVLFIGADFAPLLEGILPNLKNMKRKDWIVVGGEVPQGMTRYEDFIAGASDAEPDVDIDEEDVALIQYTAGTTGKPKGVVKTHRHLWLLGFIFGLDKGYNPDEVNLIAGPMYASAPLAFAIPAALVGATNYIMPNFNPEEVLRCIEDGKATHVFMAPIMIDFILALPEEVRNKYDVSSMKQIVVVGAPLLTKTKQGTLKLFKNAILHEMYGATETGGQTILRPELLPSEEKVRCVGLPALGFDIKIVDDEGNEVPQGEVGEVRMSGPTMFKEYYNKPEETKRAIDKDGWVGLGDMGYVDEEGYLYLVDRKYDMIISGGLNIYPSEVEEVMKNHPKIFDVTVIGVPSEKWGEEVKAVVILNSGEQATEEEIIQWCRGRMADYKRPKSVDFVSDLPRSLQGKVLKRLVKESYWKGKEIKIS